MKNIFLFFLVLIFTSVSWAASDSGRLDVGSSRVFRQWFLLTVLEQAKKKPNPRWQQRDCAGLVRFAVREALVPHDMMWRQTNGFLNKRLPPELNITNDMRESLLVWSVPGENKKSDYVTAQSLVSANTTFVSLDLSQARPGDLIFFDQGEDQHLMIFTGNALAYHTGNEKDKDEKIRVVDPKVLQLRRDSRWWINANNPNFLGVYRFSFLSW